jgi:predicted HTH transcriptional regulator
MSNLRYGGWIILGKKEKADKSYENVGVPQSTYDGYVSDDVRAYVYSHAQLPIELEVFKKEVDGKKYIGLNIRGLGKTPHIFSKQEVRILQKGIIYVRSQGKPESTEVQSYIGMKEIIDACIDNSLASFISRAHAWEFCS